MNWEELVKETIAKVRSLGEVKGAEYAKEGDRLANFRDNAKALGTNMELVWGVYAGKHWDAIRTYISDVVKGENPKRSEPIESRVDDLITYLLLFKMILREEKKEPSIIGTRSQDSRGTYHSRSRNGTCTNCGRGYEEHVSKFMFCPPL